MHSGGCMLPVPHPLMILFPLLLLLLPQHGRLTSGSALASPSALKRLANETINQTSSAAGGGALLARCDTDCYAAQRSALLQLYADTNLARTWTNTTGYDGSVSLGHCSWFGVTCCQDVANLEQLSSPAFGPPQNALPDGPPGLAFSTGIATDFSSVPIYACLPGGVRILDLSGNGLSGVLTNGAFSALAPSLQILSLSSNSLVGTIPAALVECSYLEVIELQLNALSGSPTVPALAAGWASLLRLRQLTLSGNTLSGTIPAGAFLGMTSLTSIGFSSNHFSGRPPFDLVLLPALKVLEAAHNLFSGTIPDIDLPLGGVNVQQLSFSNNQITGSIPAYLGRMPIVWFDLGNNQLTGTLPDSLSESSTLSTIMLNANKLNGTIPLYFPSPTTRELYLWGNLFSGSLHEQSFLRSRNLFLLELNDNPHLEGPLPEGIRHLWDLSSVDISCTGMQLPTLEIPSWLVPVKGDYAWETQGTPTYATCPQYGFYHSSNSEFVKLVLSPSFYHFQGCVCAGGYQAVYAANKSDDMITSMVCTQQVHHGFPLWGALTLAVVLGVIVISAFAIYLWQQSGKTVMALKKLEAKKKPPGLGANKKMTVTLVLSDVEGSTELWEWDDTTMTEALDTHDQILRSCLAKFYGYEVTTEGDSFLVAFHEPFDAVAWCLATQLALLNAAWPAGLLLHPRARLETTAMLRTKHSLAEDQRYVNSTPFSSSFRAHHVETANTVLFRGLRVRMGVATGVCEAVTIHKVTRRVEYFGVVTRRAEHIADLPCGAQVMIDSATLNGINGELGRLSKAMLPFKSSVAVEDADVQDGIQRQKSAVCADHDHLSCVMEFPELIPCVLQNVHLPQSFHISANQHAPNKVLLLGTSGPGGKFGRQVSLQGYRSNGDPLSNEGARPASRLSHPSGLPIQSESGVDLVNVSTQAFALLHSKSLDRGASLRSSWRSHQQNSSVDDDIHDDFLESPMPSLVLAKIGLCRSPSKKGASKAEEEGASVHASAITIIDCGLFSLGSNADSDAVTQVMPLGLEERAWYFPLPSPATQFTPGYFDAPVTMYSYPHGGPLIQEAVTLVFCVIKGYKDMTAFRYEVAREMLDCYNEVIRRSLLPMGGYECQELEGSFMIAFASASDSIEWCLMVQEIMVEIRWTSSMLELPHMSGHGLEGGFCGPRVKMGIYKGIPTKVVPHSTTGRADYFGPLVNRAARLCFVAAEGGQVVASRQVVEELLHGWGHKLGRPQEQAPAVSRSHLGIFSLASRLSLSSKDNTSKSRLLGVSSLRRETSGTRSILDSIIIQGEDSDPPHRTPFPDRRPSPPFPSLAGQRGIPRRVTFTMGIRCSSDKAMEAGPPPLRCAAQMHSAAALCQSAVLNADDLFPVPSGDAACLQQGSHDEQTEEAMDFGMAMTAQRNAESFPPSPSLPAVQGNVAPSPSYDAVFAAQSELSPPLFGDAIVAQSRIYRSGEGGGGTSAAAAAADDDDAVLAAAAAAAAAAAPSVLAGAGVEHCQCRDAAMKCGLVSMEITAHPDHGALLHIVDAGHDDNNSVGELHPPDRVPSLVVIIDNSKFSQPKYGLSSKAGATGMFKHLNLSMRNHPEVEERKQRSLLSSITELFRCSSLLQEKTLVQNSSREACPGTVAPLRFLHNSNNCRMGARKWLWAEQIIIADMGTFRLKGVREDHELCSISTLATSTRQFTSKLKRGKGTQLVDGTGVICHIVLVAASAPPS